MKDSLDERLADLQDQWDALQKGYGQPAYAGARQYLTLAA